MGNDNFVSAWHDQTRILDRKKIVKRRESKNCGHFQQLTMPVAADVKITRLIEQILRNAFIIKIFLDQTKKTRKQPVANNIESRTHGKPCKVCGNKRRKKIPGQCHLL